MKRLRAFTLIELLTVIAITAILMLLIVAPIIQTFNLTRAAQAWAQAQDKARTLTERIAHEINNASRTRDNSGVNGELDVVVPAKPGSGSNNVLPGTYDPIHDWIRVPIYNAKLDIIKPFEGDPSLTRAGAFVDPLSGMADPTEQTPRGQVNLPSAPGMTLVRYFVGLRNPLRLTPSGGAYAGYIEPYTGLLQQRQAIQDNLFVLYRVEVQPMIWSKIQGKFVVNKKFFYDYGRNNTSGKTGPWYDDPTFFDPAVPYPAYTSADPDGTIDPTKAQMVQNWLDKAVIQTEVARFDMIQPVYDLRTRQVVFDGNAPRLMTLVQFQPTRVSSEPAQAQVAVRPGQESDTGNPNDPAKNPAPDVFLTKYPGWAANTVVRTYNNQYNQSDPANDRYMVGLSLKNPATTDPQGFSIYGFDPAQGPYDDSQTGQTIGGTRVGFELFDVDMYKRGLREGFRANFSRGMASANTRSGWLSSPLWHTLFEPYVPDLDRGRAVASIGIDEIGVVAVAYPFAPVPLSDPLYNPSNLPSGMSWDPAKTGAGDPNPLLPKTPFNDYPRDVNNRPDLSAGVFSDVQYSTINRKYNKIWFDYPFLRGNIQRFIDLRTTPNDDGAPSPLFPDAVTGFPRSRIVPGTEQVYGPDENPGPNYGNVIRYTRTTRDPGPNQYRINYTDLPEPDYTLLGLTPPTGAPTDFTTAVFQPRYKAGYLEFDSDPNLPIPGDNPASPINEAKILVYYRFQFTQPNDVMAVDYDSRQLMTVQITIRDYPQATNLPNPQTVTLHSSASVRNFLR
ncbi:MAG: Tfp pilus assembly protein FimT/FimU [Fimbriimonadales bacterium]